MVGLMATSSKRVYAIPKFAAPRAPVLVAVHCLPLPPQERCSNIVLSPSLWGPWVLLCTKFVWALWVSLAGMVFDSESEFTPPTILLVLLLCLCMWGVSSQPLQRLYWDFSDLGCGLSPYGWSSEAWLPLLTLDVGLYPQRFYAQIRSHSEVLGGHKFSFVRRGMYSTQYAHYHFCFILFVRSKSLIRSHSRTEKLDYDF